MAPAPSPGCSSTHPTASGSGGRSAFRRTSSRLPGRRSSTHWSTRSKNERGAGNRPDPPRPARDRRSRGGARARGAALGPALARPDGRAVRAGLRRLARGRRRRRGLERDRRAPPRGPGARLERGGRGPDQPAQLRRLRQLPALRGGPAGVLRRRRRDARHRPDRRGGGGRRAHRRDPPGPHLRIPGGDGRARAGRFRARPRGPRGRLRGARGDRCGRAACRRPGQPRGVRLLREQAADDGRGRDAGPRPGRDGRPAAQRAQPGPGAGHGLARSLRARLQLPALGRRRRDRRRPGREARRDARRS